MANINVPSGSIGTGVRTLTASAEDVITFADDLDSVEVINLNGAGPLNVKAGGAAIAGATDGTALVIAAVAGAARVVPVGTAGGTTVHVYSDNAVSYAVQSGAGARAL